MTVFDVIYVERQGCPSPATWRRWSGSIYSQKNTAQAPSVLLTWVSQAHAVPRSGEQEPKLRVILHALLSLGAPSPAPRSTLEIPASCGVWPYWEWKRSTCAGQLCRGACAGQLCRGACAGAAGWSEGQEDTMRKRSALPADCGLATRPQLSPGI